MTGLMAGERVVVTGGGSGIGAATCRLIAREGGKVAVLGRRLQTVQQVAAEIGGVALQVDVRDGSQVERAVNHAAEALGGLTGMCNNAGTGSIAPLHETTPSSWERTFGVNLAGVFHGIRAAVPLMLTTGGGAIVNTASISGRRPSAGEGVYAAAKAGVVALTAAAALEYAPTIRVNAVSPGVVRAKMTDQMLTDDESGLSGRIPLGASASRKTSLSSSCSCCPGAPHGSPVRMWRSMAERRSAAVVSKTTREPCWKAEYEVRRCHP